MSIHVLPGDSVPPRVSKKDEGSTFAFLISVRAERTSGGATRRVFAAFLSTSTHFFTSWRSLSELEILIIINFMLMSQE